MTSIETAKCGPKSNLIICYCSCTEIIFHTSSSIFSFPTIKRSSSSIIFRITRQGFPTARDQSGISFVTTLPAGEFSASKRIVSQRLHHVVFGIPLARHSFPKRKKQLAAKSVLSKTARNNLVETEHQLKDLGQILKYAEKEINALNRKLDNLNQYLNRSSSVQQINDRKMEKDETTS